MMEEVAEHLRIGFRPSPVLAGLLLALHALAALSALLSLDGWALILVGCGIIASATTTAGEALLLWPSSIVECVLAGGASARWRERRGRWHAGRLAGGTESSSFLLTLALAEPGIATRRIAVAADALKREDFRALRRWLRWLSEPPSSAPTAE